MPQVTLVTGAGGALGAAMIDVLAEAGHSLVAFARKPSARFEAARARLGTRMVVADPELGDTSALASALADAEAALGPLDGAVLVAGGWRGGSLAGVDGDDDAYRTMLSQNLDTVHATLRAVLPGMVTRRRGSIVVVGSRAAVRPDTSAGAAAYAASKAAAVALAQAAAAEVLSHGVRISAVLPSTIDTPQNRAAMPDADPTRWVSPEDVARAARFLLSDDARAISGAALPVYGQS